MQNLFSEVSSLDQRTIQMFSLSEEVMMEHAALALEAQIRKRFTAGAAILIVCGGGNNGADGMALARLLRGEYRVTLHLPMGAGSPLAQKQLLRCEALGLCTAPIEEGYDVIVDALFGSGLNRPLESSAISVLTRMNSLNGFKIACDVPSGLLPDGTHDLHAFDADLTVTMGALKRSLFSDDAKEITGEIVVANLGIPREHYEIPSRWKLLDRDDLSLPRRIRCSSHKGSFGHLTVVCGEKTGAAVIAGSAALRFGAGLVSLISNENVHIPYELMQSHSLPATTTAIAVGMGLGSEFGDDELDIILDHDHPIVLDADIFYHPMFIRLLKRNRVVLTPHPKEFTRILRITGIADIDVSELQRDRFTYAEKFCAAYPHTVLLLKGSNVIVGQNDMFYVNPHGTVALAKGGSGDVLGGLVGALLAQGFSPLDAAIQGTLAHAIASQSFEMNNYALTPFDLIERIAAL